MEEPMPARRPSLATATKAILFPALALGTVALAGCDESQPEQTNPNAFSWSAPRGSATVLNVRNANGGVTVEPSADTVIRVRATTRWRGGDPTSAVHFEAVPEANAVTICAIWNKGSCSATDYASSKNGKGLTVSLNKSDVTADFTVEAPAGMRVDVFTLNGAVMVRAAAPVKAHTLNGDVKVGTSVGPVDAETINGDVDVRMTTMGPDSGAVRAVSKHGTVVAYVPNIVNGVITASTLNGNLGTDFGGPIGDVTGRSKDFKATLGAGGREYVVSTLSGSAWLRQINADGTVAPAAQTPAVTEKGQSTRRAKAK
jgi:hypothetical protein